MKISTVIARILPTFVLVLGVQTSRAGSAAWNSDDGASQNWNNAANWTPATVPNAPADTATFNLSNFARPALSANTEVDAIVFSAAATNFFFIFPEQFALTLSGTGITNNSGITQLFSTAGVPNSAIKFTNNASAGSLIEIHNPGGGSAGGVTQFFNTATAANVTIQNEGGVGDFALGGATHFFDTSTAGNAIINNNTESHFGGIVAEGGNTEFHDAASADHGTFTNSGSQLNGGLGATIRFFDSSTAGSGTFINNPGTVSGTLGGFIAFDNSATAGNGMFTNNGATVSGAGSAELRFINSSAAGNATLIANGGSNGGLGALISFQGDADGGTAQVEVFGNGTLDITGHNPTGMTIGSIEGTGSVCLGANNLTVGSNNLSTIFSGVIQDGGQFGGTGGALTKVGTGTLTLGGANTYTGVTTVDAGGLVLNGSLTSSVTVNGGVLGGTGIINGALIVGSGGVVDLTGGTFTVNGPITNGGLFIVSNGAQLAGVTSFTNNGTLDIITAGAFSPPPGFTNNGVILDSSVVKTKTASRTGTTFTLTINGYTGHTYQLQTSSSPAGNTFANIGPPQQGSTGNVLTFTDASAAGPNGFYRILVNP